MTEVALDNRHLITLIISGVLAAIVVTFIVTIVVALWLVSRRKHRSAMTLDENAMSTATPVQDMQVVSHSCAQQRELVDRLVLFMEQNKPYLESHITVERLANKLNVSPKLLSSTINNQLHVNFFELIGNYRVAEAKKRLADAALRQQSISEIMKSCGFNSKSVFNQAFKKSEGVTPSHYRQQHLH